MIMGRAEDTAHGIANAKGLLIEGKVSVGEFRRFVNKTGYITDCEKQDGAWIYASRKQWVRKPDASWDNPYRPQQEGDPVALVSWYDAVMFANWKSGRDGLVKAYHFADSRDRRSVEWDRQADGYRLPTAQEWEACTDAVPPREGSGTARGGRGGMAAISPVLPPQLACEGIISGHRLEWCWDHRAGDRSKQTISVEASSQGCRRIVIDAGTTGHASHCCGACHPLTAIGTLGFRLVRGRS